MTTTDRSFLFLQGPHGPFFAQLARKLRVSGAATHKIGFNGGDALFWTGSPGYLAFRGADKDWPEFLERTVADRKITDIVVYGEGRYLHDFAIEFAHSNGIRTHIFEEGYLRPYWVSYERDGSNGKSPLRSIPLSAMRSELPAVDVSESAAGWGELREHMFYGATYHAALMLGRAFYPNYVGHRDISVGKETLLNIWRLFARPAMAIRRRAATARIRLGGFPYHLALLQLQHDASFRGHSPFATMAEFAEVVVEEFAKGAKPHHHLIFKAHPLEDGRAGLRRAIRNAARQRGVEDRVHYLTGGKLAGLLDDALSAVTINSTAGQQVLRRGIPMKAMGEAVYSGRGFTSEQPLHKFFANPETPDLEAYKTFRRYQLQTCQIRGGFYATRGRIRLLRRVVDKMLAKEGPYARTNSVTEESRYLQLVEK